MAERDSTRTSTEVRSTSEVTVPTVPALASYVYELAEVHQELRLNQSTTLLAIEVLECRPSGYGTDVAQVLRSSVYETMISSLEKLYRITQALEEWVPKKDAVETTSRKTN